MDLLLVSLQPNNQHKLYNTFIKVYGITWLKISDGVSYFEGGTEYI